MVAAAVVGSAVVSGVASSAAAKKTAKAAGNAADAQAASAQAGIDEQARQFDSVRELLNPYVQAGTGGNFNAQQYLSANPDVAADPYFSQHPEEHFNQIGKFENRPGAQVGSLTAQQSLLGLNGGTAQANAIAGIQNSPGFTSLLAQGENSIRQNAAATGGLRGGNTQGALAQFSPQLLAQQIQQQYSNLSGITGMSQNAAAGVGNAGMSTGNSIAGLLQQQGAAQAGGYMGSAAAANQGYAGIASGLGTLAGYGGFGGFGNSAASSGGILGYQPSFGSTAAASSAGGGFGSTITF